MQSFISNESTAEVTTLLNIKAKAVNNRSDLIEAYKTNAIYDFVTSRKK